MAQLGSTKILGNLTVTGNATFDRYRPATLAGADEIVGMYSRTLSKTWSDGMFSASASGETMHKTIDLPRKTNRVLLGIHNTIISSNRAWPSPLINGIPSGTGVILVEKDYTSSRRMSASTYFHTTSSRMERDPTGANVVIYNNTPAFQGGTYSEMGNFLYGYYAWNGHFILSDSLRAVLRGCWIEDENGYSVIHFDFQSTGLVSDVFYQPTIDIYDMA